MYRELNSVTSRGPYGLEENMFCRHHLFPTNVHCTTLKNHLKYHGCLAQPLKCIYSTPIFLILPQYNKVVQKINKIGHFVYLTVFLRLLRMGKDGTRGNRTELTMVSTYKENHLDVGILFVRNMSINTDQQTLWGLKLNKNSARIYIKKLETLVTTLIFCHMHTLSLNNFQDTFSGLMTKLVCFPGVTGKKTPATKFDDFPINDFLDLRARFMKPSSIKMYHM